MAKDRNTWRSVRILILLLVLAFVAADQFYTRTRSTSWERSQWLVIYPVNADGSQASADYIAALRPEDFQPIEAFFAEEAARYGLALARPIEVKLGPEVKERPPAPPPGGSALDVMLWSLHFRYWSATHSDYDGPANQQLYVNYFEATPGKRLQDSLGLQKGQSGIVNAFAERRMRRQNQVIIAHELLHLFGASDKYDRATNLPLYPIGYAEPELEPRYPQRWTEIMGGRLPLGPQRAEIPESLQQVLIGEGTALEINWLALPED